MVVLILTRTTEGVGVTTMEVHGRPGLRCVVILNTRMRNAQLAGTLLRHAEETLRCVRRGPRAGTILSKKGKSKRSVARTRTVYGCLIRRKVSERQLVLRRGSADAARGLGFDLKVVKLGRSINVIAGGFRIFQKATVKGGYKYERVCPVPSECHS